MRTTVPQLVKALRKRAAEFDRAFRSVLEEAVARSSQAPPARRRYRLKSASLGEALPGVELRKARVLAETLEDDEVSRKLALRT